MMEARLCRRCHEIKPLEAFSQSVRTGRKTLHISPYCKPCAAAITLEWRAAHLEQSRASCRKWRAENKARLAALSADWREKNPDAVSTQALSFTLRRYGLTQEDFQRMLEAQRGGCALCGRTPPAGKRLAVDHDHETGRVRGLLCHWCNTGLGWYEHIGRERAEEYLAGASTKQMGRAG